MGAYEKTTAALSPWIGFVARQQHDWIITATRTSIFRFFYQMVLPYLSIYTLALGATGTQLGMVNSIGMLVAGLLGPLTGLIIDRIGNKVIYLIGIVLIAISWFLYGIAHSWTIIIVAMLAYWVGFGTSMHSCSVICGNCLANEDRATAMSVCETLASGLLGMVGPMIGAFLVTRFGGVNVEGIRPLFYICLVSTIFTFFLILYKLPGQKNIIQSGQGLHLFRDLSQVFKYGQSIKRLIVISSIAWLPMGMIIPFTQAFANELKGADSYTLGAMVTGFALTPFLLGIPLGRLADRIGRKKVLYALGPLVWVSNLVLIWAPNAFFLVVSGVLQGFIYINMVIMMAMVMESVPKEYMGRWMGVNRFFRMILASVAAYGAGAIWDNIGPAFLFLAFIGVDLLIRIPLLITVPETVGLQIKNGSGHTK
jgi:MFS family permease